MRIAILAPGSRGDVQPYVALGRGLVQAGHDVRLVTHLDFEDLVASNGLDFWPLAGKVQDIAQSTQMQARIEKGNFLAVMGQMAREAQGGALVLAEGGLAACRGVDLLLAGIGGLFSGYSVAEKLDLPLVQAHYIPFTPTREYPSFLIPPLPVRLGGGFNRLSYHLAQQMMWQGFRGADKRARKEVLDLPAGSFWEPFRSGAVRGKLNVILHFAGGQVDYSQQILLTIDLDKIRPGT